MRLALKNIERVEIYLNDELNAENRKAFENEIATNGELAEALAEVKLLRKAIHRKELRAKINNSRPKGGFNSTLVIGLIGLVVALGLWSLWPNEAAKISNVVNTENTEITKSSESASTSDSVFTEQTDAIDEKIDQETDLGGKKVFTKPDIQKFTFNSAEGATIVGKDGMLIIVPKNGFIDDAGKELKGKVELKLFEALGISEMVLYDLHTVSNGSNLESGGMFYTEATIGGSPAKINPKRPFYIEIPTTERDMDMKLFKGEVKSDGRINWIDPTPLQQSLVTIPLSELDFLPDGFANEVSSNMPFLGYKAANDNVTDSLYYSLNWGRQDFSNDKELFVADTDASEGFQGCGIDPASIETIKKPRFQNSLIATKEFEERVRELHKAENGDALLQIYIQNLDKDLHVCDALVANSANGDVKKAFEDFAKKNLGKIKDAALYSDRLQAYYVKRRKELRGIHDRISADYNKKNEAELNALTAKRNSLSSNIPPNLNPPTVRQSSGNVFATQWATGGWGNIDKYLALSLFTNGEEVSISIENESENTNVNIWLGDINTYTGLARNDGNYRAMFPKWGKGTVSHVFAIAETSEGYSWGYKNFDSRLEKEIQFAMASADIADIKMALAGVEMNFGRLKNRLNQIKADRARRERTQRDIEKQREVRREEIKRLAEAYSSELARQNEIAIVISKLRNVAFPCDQRMKELVTKPLPLNPTSAQVIEEQAFTIVEQMPSFPGGDDAMMKFIGENIKYPREAMNDKISGVVYVTFVVNAEGDIRNPRVLRSLSPECDAEVIRVINKMPRWDPGRQRKTAVSVQYNLPITFSP